MILGPSLVMVAFLACALAADALRLKSADTWGTVTLLAFGCYAFWLLLCLLASEPPRPKAPPKPPPPPPPPPVKGQS